MNPPDIDTKNKEPIEVPSADQPAGESQQTAEPAQRASAETKRTAHSVTLENLRAYYGSQESIKGISIKFPANEITALIGPSGSGKSTVVRCINRMHEEIPGARADGEVLLDDLTCMTRAST
jgi:phosphate transport system ATP-binding protein